eukprot:TRINITY_DN3996_c0_g1_i1.p1 TRINITY_DN3996_c0_g1~~TRINITY_DN3996_c0_g1_i1.p1  ORF type:complete len:504 (+),score=67.91 TRINITY_DN3996_c0_g1_i1:104-1615(+)
MVVGIHDPLGGLSNMLQGLVAEVKQTSAELLVLKEHMTKMSDDVYGVGGLRHEMHSSRGTVRVLEHLVRSERLRQRAFEAGMMKVRGEKALLGAFFTRWEAAAARRDGRVGTQRTLSKLHGIAAFAAYSHSFTRWRRCAARQQALRKRARALYAVKGRAMNGLLRTRYTAWRDWADARCYRRITAGSAVTTAMDDLAALNQHAFMHRMFTKLRCYGVQKARFHRLALPSARVLRSRCLRALYLHAKLGAFHRKRREDAATLERRTCVNTMAPLYHLWRELPAWRRAVARKARGVVWVAQQSAKQLARRYYTTLRRYVSTKQELGQRVRWDMGLVGAGNHNRAVEGLAERVSVLFSHITHLENDKLGRKELGALLDAGSGRPPPGGLSAQRRPSVSSASTGGVAAALDTAHQVLAQSSRRDRLAGDRAVIPGAVDAGGSCGGVGGRGRAPSPLVPHGGSGAQACLAGRGPFAGDDEDALWESHFAEMQRSSSARSQLVGRSSLG